MEIPWLEINNSNSFFVKLKFIGATILSPDNAALG